MKKVLLAVTICAFAAGSAVAADFAAEQAKMLGNVIAKMDQVKNDPAQLNSLTAQRNCVEKATKVEELGKCMDLAKGETKKVVKK